jgi:hypothetical protein
MLRRQGALRSADHQAALAFIETAWSLADERPFRLQTLAALGKLISADVIAYCELDRVQHRSLDYVGADEDENDGELFWRIDDEHPPSAATSRPTPTSPRSDSQTSSPGRGCTTHGSTPSGSGPTVSRANSK